MPAAVALAIHRRGDKFRSHVDGTLRRNVGFSLYPLAEPKDFRGHKADESGGYWPIRGREKMSEPSAIDAASRRLALALDALAAAVERRHEADRGEQTLDAQLHALGTDRS